VIRFPSRIAYEEEEMADQSNKTAVVKNALQSAIGSLTDAHVAKLKDASKTPAVIVTNPETAAKIHSIFGAEEPFVQENGPSWVEYHDHRTPQDWSDVAKTAIAQKTNQRQQK
jgi:hypothetical protein